MLHKEIPFIRIGLPFYAGIAAGLYFSPGKTTLIVSFLASVSVIIISSMIKKKIRRRIFGMSFTVVMFISGLALFLHQRESLTELPEKSTEITCILTEYPLEKPKSFKLTARLSGIKENKLTKVTSGSIIIYCRKQGSMDAFLPGDYLLIRCTPEEIRNNGNPCEFDYRFYSECHGIKYTAFINPGDIMVHKAPVHRKLKYTALIARAKIIKMYMDRGITGEKLALVSAMTLGERSQLDQEQKQEFIRAGVMHIMAVSGLHAVIISMFFFRLLFFLKGRLNFLRIVLTITALWMFAFMTGLTPSVLRAALMYTFLQAGGLLRRPVNNINSVLASAFILAVANPFVIFDAGFQLSYAAVLFIIVFYNELYSKIAIKNRIGDFIWQSFAVTLTAQAGTLPLTILLFNRFPVYFLLTNLIIVPLSSLLIITGCIFPFTFPLKFISMLVARVLNAEAAAISWLTSGASSLPLANLEGIGMTAVESILLMTVIFSSGLWLLKKKPVTLPVVLSLFIIYLGTVTLTDIHTGSTNELIVYKSIQYTSIGIRLGKTLNIWSDTTEPAAEVYRHLCYLRLKHKMHSLAGNIECIQAGSAKIMICKAIQPQLIRSFSPDYIIYTGETINRKNENLPVSYRGTVIMTRANSAGTARDKSSLEGFRGSVYTTRRSGAFIVSLGPSKTK